MSFTLKLGDVVDFTPYLREILLENPTSDGYLHFVAHPGGCRSSSSSNVDRSPVSLESEMVESPESVTKIKSLLSVLDSFGVSQLNDNLKIYLELNPSFNRSLEYSVFVLTEHKFAIIVCDQYGEAIRFKKYDDHVPLESIIHEISSNHTKGELDSVGFLRIPMSTDAYTNDSSRENFFREFLESNAFVDNSVAIDLISSNSLEYAHLLHSEYVSQVKDFFSDDDGYFDISRISIRNKNAFQSSVIRFSELAKLFNVDRVEGHVRWDKNCSLFQILRSIYYNCPVSLSRIDEIDKPPVELPSLDELKSILYKKFSDEHGLVDISLFSKKNIGKFSEYFGASFVRIASAFKIKGRNNTAFVEILKQVFTDDVSQQRLDDKLCEINPVSFNNEEILNIFKNYFTDSNDSIDFSKINHKFVKDSMTLVGVSLNVAIKQIMPSGTPYTSTLSDLYEFLKYVFRDSPSNLALLLDKQNVYSSEIDIQKYITILKSKLSHNGLFDLSVSLSPVIRSFKKSVGITMGKFVSSLDYTFEVTTPNKPLDFLPVLKHLYFDCPQSLNNIQILESRLSKEIISDDELVLRIKNHFTNEDSVVSEDKLSCENVRSLYEGIGIGPQAIFTRFNRQSTNPYTIAEFVYLLLDLFADCPESLNIIQEKIRRINS